MKKMIINPLFIFSSVWFIIIIFYSFKVSYFFPKDNNLIYTLAFGSIITFSIGFLSLALIDRKKIHYEYKHINIYNYVNFVRFILLVISLIVFINVIIDGLPPFFNFLGINTKNYMEYGRLKNILFAFLIFLFVISEYDKGPRYKIISILLLVIYVTRGNIIFAIITFIFLKIQENKITNKRIIVLFTLLILFTILLFQIIGDYRTGSNVFYDSLEIKENYRIKNAGVIWVISYISMPIVNLIEIIKHSDYYFYGQNILNNSLPAFINISSKASEYIYSLLPNKNNTVSTYLSNVYLDFGLLGIILYNYLIGIFSGYLYFFSRNNVLKSVFLTSITLSFFYDYFSFFQTIVIIVLSIIFNRYVLEGGRIK